MVYKKSGVMGAILALLRYYGGKGDGIMVANGGCMVAHMWLYGGKRWSYGGKRWLYGGKCRKW
eukprot:m.15015 g.15015  ORF g.15015 m.15015 type:complete len:63 (-) comp10389_c0_seq1:144-332(-)